MMRFSRAVHNCAQRVQCGKNAQLSRHATSRKRSSFLLLLSKGSTQSNLMAAYDGGQSAECPSAITMLPIGGGVRLVPAMPNASLFRTYTVGIEQRGSLIGSRRRSSAWAGNEAGGRCWAWPMAPTVWLASKRWTAKNLIYSKVQHTGQCETISHDL